MPARLSLTLLKWYEENKRTLPWRNETDPYRIWLSEVILQQTQVAQGLNYYLRFLREFPDVNSLASAHEDRVLKVWQGLGYYSRARNLHETAKHVSKKLGGTFPNTYTDLLGLKGIGSYTAAAIASFSFDLPHAVVDGNVYRVLSRLYGIGTPIDSSEGKKEFNELANRLLDKKNPGLYNQAIMEFGALQCRPLNPSCDPCPLRRNCVAREKNMVTLLPVKAKKSKVRKRYFNYLVIADKKRRLQVNKRTGSDIWKGLYEFKLMETENELQPAQFLAESKMKQLLKNGYNVTQFSKPYRHVLTHQQLFARFYVMTTKKEIAAEEAIPLNKIQQLAFPSLIGKFLADYDLKEMLYF